MEIKSLVAGALGIYGVLLILSTAGISLMFTLPIEAFGIDVGRLVLGIICAGLAFFLIKGRK